MESMFHEDNEKQWGYVVHCLLLISEQYISCLSHVEEDSQVLNALNIELNLDLKQGMGNGFSGFLDKVG